MVLCGMYASSRYSFFLYETQDLKNVDIGSFMDNFLRLVRDDFEKKGIALETALDPGMTAKAELRALQQVLLNILPMQQMEKMKEIFKPFFTTKSRGTGLGLVIVKKMLARMNGMIDIKSGVDAGIVVDIVIPGGTDERS
jgi:signal transduction histidine kinase